MNKKFKRQNSKFKHKLQNSNLNIKSQTSNNKSQTSNIKSQNSKLKCLLNFTVFFLFPFCRSLRFAPCPPKRGGGRALRPRPLPRRPPPLSLRWAAPRSLRSLRPGARPPNRSLRGFCGGSCRPHPPLLRCWAGVRRTAPAGRRPSDTRPAAPLLRSQAGAHRTAPAGRRPLGTCLATPCAPCDGHPNAPVGRDRVSVTLRTSHARHGLIP